LKKKRVKLGFAGVGKLSFA